MGERVTGVTTMRIDAGLDTGDILLQREVAISERDTSVTLAPRLAMVGAELMADTLNGLQGGTIKPRPQEDSHASLAPILKREDGLIDFRHTATETLNRLKGFQPWPGAYTLFRGKTLQVHDAGVADKLPGGRQARVRERRVARLGRAVPQRRALPGADQGCDGGGAITAAGR